MKCFCFCCLLFLFSFGQVFANDLQQANELYDHAYQIRMSDRAGAVELLQQSVDLIPSFDAYFFMGLLQIDLARLTDANKSFVNAHSVGGLNGNQLAEIKGRKAHIMGLQKKYTQAIVSLRVAEDKHSQPPPSWMAELRKQFDRESLNLIASARDITEGMVIAKRGFSVSAKPPSIDVRILFQTNKADLDQEGKDQVVQLATALVAEDNRSFDFRIVGHTDVRGDNSHNQRLSERRAQTVVRELIKLKPELRRRLESEGRGENELLYNDSSRASHRLNRRVEVQILK